MITDHTLDQTLIELARAMKALEVLRKARKASGDTPISRPRPSSAREHAAALRASLDLTRKLTDLRQGR